MLTAKGWPATFAMRALSLSASRTHASATEGDANTPKICEDTTRASSAEAAAADVAAAAEAAGAPAATEMTLKTTVAATSPSES